MNKSKFTTKHIFKSFNEVYYFLVLEEFENWEEQTNE